ncbi:MAG: L,D-transpeptidase family protein [Deltaproteobacteria bacterium]|nr:L,D-transpeptidase family protein [Deltaproteobacteria bacterium]
MRIDQATKLIVLPVIFLFASVAVQAKTTAGIPLQKVPAALIEPGSGADSYSLVVEKATQRLFLYKFKAGHFYLRSSFPVSTGENMGDKMKEGDIKTPEGFYLFNNKFIKGELADIYGVLAYPMDYPNFWDRRLGKAGKGIWLHGTNRTLVPQDSNGCVALKNIHLIKLESIIRLHNTPLIIYDQIEYKNIRDIQREARQIKTFIETWRSAWERKDFKLYRSLYVQDFSSNSGMNYTAWMAHKARLNQKYRKINVKVKRLRIFKHQGMIVATFKQYYRGGPFISNGNKRLYLHEGKDGYRIMAEVWSPFPPTHPKKTLPLLVRNQVIQEARLASLSTTASKAAARSRTILEREKIRRLVEHWLADWRNKDVDGYISHYHPGFRYRNMDLAGYRDYKNRIFEKYREISIGVRKLRVKVEAPRAEVTFIQDFHSNQYQDRGLKKLILVKHGNGWRIKEESWDQIRAGAKP